jgi:hypothetical protein
MAVLLRFTVSLMAVDGRTITSEVGHIRGPVLNGLSTLADLSAEDRNLAAEILKDFAAQLAFDEEVD